MPLRTLLVACLLLGSTAAVADPSVWGAVGAGSPLELAPISGRLVARSAESVTVRDGQGALHTLRLTDRTRYVWNERSSLRDFAPGARVRAEVDVDGGEQVVRAVWILAGPRA